MIWTEGQAKALKAVDHWFYQESKKKQIFRIYGYAGTGKTTLAKHFAKDIGEAGEVAFGAFSGKAALVMAKNGCYGARTLHSLVYLADQDPKTGEIKWRLNRAGSPLKTVKLLIIDECSMVNEELGRDICSFGVPILVLGDPGQLPPPEGSGFFTKQEPDIMLTEVRRQAKDNPIIYLADLFRNKEYPALGSYGESVVTNKMLTTDLLESDVVMVGRNSTRFDYNQKIRRLRGIDSALPIKGEKLICLKNDKDLQIFNGGIFTVEEVITPKYKSNLYHALLRSDDVIRPLLAPRIHPSMFDEDVPKPTWQNLRGTQEFDFGYVLTVHRAQGSQWNNSLIVDESYCFREFRWNWLYTAATRSIEKTKLVVS